MKTITKSGKLKSLLKALDKVDEQDIVNLEIHKDAEGKLHLSLTTLSEEDLPDEEGE